MLFLAKIYGILFSIFTFPGVIVHEIAHRFFCDITKTPVYEVKYFEISNDMKTLGYVNHGQVKGLLSTALVCIGPLIINTFLCFVFTIPFAIATAARAGNVLSLPHFILLWLGFSIGSHAIPSSQDISNLTKYINLNHNGLIQFLYLPFRLLFFLTRILSFFWLDAILSGLMIYGNVQLFSIIFKLKNLLCFNRN